MTGPNTAAATAEPEGSKAKKDLAGIAHHWWRGLQDTIDGAPNPRADRAARARLRRMEGGDAFAAADPVVMNLHVQLWGERWHDETSPNQLAISRRLALVLAHVRDEAPKGPSGWADRFARSLGPSRIEEDDGKLKLLRFRSLLAARDEVDVVRRFRRAVDLSGNRANVRDLAGVLLFWDRDDTRTRFAFDYFAAGAAAPGAAIPDDARANAATVA